MSSTTTPVEPGGDAGRPMTTRRSATMRPIKGPSALGSDPRRFWHLTRTLAVTEFKLRFFGSALGYLWQLMRPLLLFAILYVLFTQVLALDTAPFYPEALLLGLVLYTFFADATKGSVTSLVARENLLRKIEFPRLAVPLGVVLNALFNLVLNLLPVLVFLLVDGGTVRVQWLEFPILIVAARGPRDGPGDDPVVVLRALSRHRADLGRRAVAPLLRDADLLHDQPRGARRTRRSPT